MIGNVADYTHNLSRAANFGMIYNADRGFLAGPYLPPQENDHCGKN